MHLDPSPPPLTKILGSAHDPYPANSFVLWKMSSIFTSAVYIQVCFKLDFIMEANNMDPYCLQHRLPKNDQTIKVQACGHVHTEIFS